LRGLFSKPTRTIRKGHPAGRLTLERLEDRVVPSSALDATFGTGGKVVANFQLPGSAQASAEVIQPDGKIVVAGVVATDNYSNFGLTRSSADGTLDTSFGSGGKVALPFSSGTVNARGMALQADGKIVVVGTDVNLGNNTSDFAVTRYNANGTLDTSFGTSGVTTTAFATGSQSVADSVAIQSNGQIVVAGTAVSPTQSVFAVARYNTNGVLDTSFGSGGEATTAISGFAYSTETGVALQSNGKIVLAGYTTNSSIPFYFALARLNADGSPDTTFGVGGIITTDFRRGSDMANSVLVQPDNNIVAVGYETDPSSIGLTSCALARYLTSASPHASIGGPYTLLEGKSLTLDASDSFDPNSLPLTYSWTINGVANAASGVNPTLSAAQLQALGIDDGPGTFAVSVTVSNSYTTPATASTTLTLNDAPPVQSGLSLSAAKINENGGTTLSGTFSDPGPNDTHTVVVNWGDGSANTIVNLGAGVLPFSGLAHQYLDNPTGQPNGSYSIGVTVTDPDNASVTTATSVEVDDVPPTVAVSGPADGVTYQNRLFTLTANDPVPEGPAGQFAFAINWGDGTTQSVTNNSGVVVNHVYTTTGNFTVAVTATDADEGVSVQPGTMPVAIASAELQSDPAAVGGAVGLAIGGTAATDTFVLDPGAASGTIKVTRNGAVLGTFAIPGGTGAGKTTGNVYVFDGPAAGNAVTTHGAGFNGTPTDFNNFTLSGATATFDATTYGKSTRKYNFTISTNNVQAVTLQGQSERNYSTLKDATVASTPIGGPDYDVITLQDTGTVAAAPTAVQEVNATLTGSNLATTWTLSGNGSGTLQEPGGPLDTFAGVKNLNGGTANDVFRFTAGGSLPGVLNGGGTNTLDYSALPARVFVDLNT
jgi:uncharacterized delta-60 repeat protein